MGVFSNVGIVFALLLSVTLAMEIPHAARPNFRFPEHLFKKKKQPPQPLPITKIFNLPSPTPVWPPGNGYSKGTIDLGGLQVSQITTFSNISSIYERGPDNLGVTLFDPKGIPEGFSMLGSYAQQNNKALFGWVLVAKDVSNNGTLAQPTGYTQVWNTESLGIPQDKPIYVWKPIPPPGYAAVGHLVTDSPMQPSVNRVRVVRSDLTDPCEKTSVIWDSPDGFTFYETRPSNRGTQAPGVQAGTLYLQKGDGPISISCLKNTKSITAPMPNVQQIEALVKAYSPVMFLHPDEPFLPSSVNWFFANGGLLYKKGNESNPVPIEPNGTNLPHDPNSDDAYWLDLPADDANKERVKKGNLTSARAYVHVKPMLGGTFSDIAMWVYYPFNGPAKAKVEFFNVDLGKIGQHVSDWEHVTLRVSNFNGQLWEVYYSQHALGQWVKAYDLEFQTGNKPTVYSSLHGHASYPHPGLVLQGTNKMADSVGTNMIGIRNDTSASEIIMDFASFELVSADYLGLVVVEPPWLKFFRKWGPKIDYNVDDELRKIEKMLLGKLKSLVEKIVRGLPPEVLGEEGPLGPKVKNNWSGDEV